jgi:flavorubredoxin
MQLHLSKHVTYIGSIDWDRRIFDQLISIPFGTTYNSYLLQGSDKTAIIDSVDPAKVTDLEKNLTDSSVSHVDYIVCQHAEQDHSGSIPYLLEKFPEAKVVTNEKCKGFLIDLLSIPEDKFLLVKDQDTLSLGNITLRFLLTPWVHWPETMVTYYEEEEILFSCDFFGSHVATSDLITDTPMLYLEPAKHYFAEIMMPFRNIIQKNLAKIAPLSIQMIAPSHGPIYKDPNPILKAYEEWASDQTKPMVIIAYVSMHDSTKQMVEYVTKKLMENSVAVKVYNLPNSDIGEVATDLVDASSMILASPTVLAGAHPEAVYAAFLTNALRPKLKAISIIGSYGWGGKMVEQIQSLLPNLKAEIIEPVLAKGTPKEEDFKKLDVLVQAFTDKNQ